MKGRNKYVPPFLLEELSNIKSEDKLIRDVDAMLKIVGYSQLGRKARKRGFI